MFFKTTVFGVSGIVLFYVLPQTLIVYIEPLFLGLYLFFKIREEKKLFISLDKIFVVGQILVTLANAQLAGFLAEGQSGGMYNYIIPGWIAESFEIRFIGTLCFLLGFQLFTKSIPWMNNNINIDRSKTLFIVSILLLFQNNLIGLRLPGAIGSLLDWFPIASILFLSRQSYKYEDYTCRVYALILVASSIVFAFLFSILRFEILLPIIGFFLGAFLAQPSIKFFISVRFVPFYVGVFAFSLFFAAFGQIRSSTQGAERLTAITQAKEDLDDRESEEKDGAFQRSADLCQITNVVELKKSNDFTQGETIAVLGIALIPRFLWPSKPLIALGVWFAVKIGKALPTEDGWYNTSINMTIPGHLWLEFGNVGLIIGSLLIGMFYSLVWRSCGKLEDVNNYTGTLFGSYMLITTLAGIGADLQIVISVLALFLIVLMVSRTINLFSR